MAFSSWRTWVTGEVVTAAHLNQEVRDNGEALFPDEATTVSWTPNMEGTTSGLVAATSGRRFRIGPLQFVWARFTGFGGGDITGTFFVTLPVAASGIVASGSSGSGQTIGGWSSRNDDSTGTNESGSVTLRSTTTVHFQRSVGGVVTDSNPFVWVSGDVLTFHAVYPVA